MNSRVSSAADISARLQLRGEFSASWFVIVSDYGLNSKALTEFRDDMLLLSGSPVRIIDCDNTTITAIVEFLHRPGSDIVILVELDKWSTAHWEALDLNRSGLERRGALIFWLSEEAVSLMFEHAPNVRSYVALSLFHLGTDEAEIADTERLHRLQELSDRFMMNSDEVIRRAEDGSLPSTPSFAEWLVLLKRGDLL